MSLKGKTLFITGAFGLAIALRAARDGLPGGRRQRPACERYPLDLAPLWTRFSEPSRGQGRRLPLFLICACRPKGVLFSLLRLAASNPTRLAVVALVPAGASDVSGQCYSLQKQRWSNRE